jgi:hypothetical protein
MYSNEKKSNETLEKITKLKINTSAKPTDISYDEPPLTARQEFNLQENNRNFVIDNHILYNKLHLIHDEIRELIHILKQNGNKK